MKKFLLSSVAAAILTPGASIAQQEQEVIELEEILVTGVRGSVLNSISQKRNASGFVEAIAADELGKFPDLNLGESLQRLPGVTLNRSNNSGTSSLRAEGDGSQINLRGLSPEFTRIEVNGVTGTSSFSSSFDFNILASELFSNVKVFKTSSAKRVEGGLAGSVELNTPSAFDREGTTLVGSVTGQYGDLSDEFDPRVAFLYSSNVNDTVGVTASIAYSNALFRTNMAGGISARPLADSGSDALVGNSTQAERDALIPTTINFETSEDERETLGLTLGLQFRPSDNLELKIDGIYSELDSDHIFTRLDAPPESGVFNVSNSTIDNGVLTSATLDDVQNRIAVWDSSRVEEFSILSAEAKYTPNDKWSITPYIGYSRRETSSPISLLSFARGGRGSTGALTGQLDRFPVDFNINGAFTEFQSGGTFDQLSDGSEFLLNVLLYFPEEDLDEELSAKLDLSREFDNAGPLTRIDFGARYSDREVDRRFSFFVIDNDGDIDLRTLPTLDLTARLVDFDISGQPASFPNQVLTGDPGILTEAYLASSFDVTRPTNVVAGDVSTATIANTSIPGTVFLDLRSNGAVGSFSGTTETSALYFETTFESGNLLVNAGARYIDTDQSSSGFQVVDNVATPVTFNNSYDELLPNISARYSVSDDVVLRSSFAKTLTRPRLFDLRVSEQFDGVDESGGSGGSRGNPELLPFTADNFDLGVEWYFAEEGLISLNYFKKDISDLIVTDTVTQLRTFRSQVTGLDVTAPIIFTVPTNSDSDSTIDGFEANIQGRFTFLPEGWLRNFGGILNYTRVDSDAAFLDDSQELQGTGLPGLSTDSFNAVLYYDDGRIDGRLGYTWRDRYLNVLNDNFGTPSFAEDRGQLDLSLNYDFSDKLTLQFQILNLTEERFDIQSIRNVPHTATQFDRQWFFGARYLFF